MHYEEMEYGEKWLNFEINWNSFKTNSVCYFYYIYSDNSVSLKWLLELDEVPIRIPKTDAVTHISQDAEGTIPSAAVHISIPPCFHN
jgi:hypothetical protein